MPGYPMKYKRVLISGEAIVIAFDMCSSSNIIEELTLTGDVKRLEDFLTSLKRFLAKAQEKIDFDPYKFMGDGWILLFPASVEGGALSLFLHDLCDFYPIEFEKCVVQFLGHPPKVIGLTFGIEKGPLLPMTIYGQREYVGRAINIACRLQSAVKDKGGSPAYKALISNRVYLDYFDGLKLNNVFSVRRTLRNINHGKEYRCRKIELFVRAKKGKR